MSLTHGIYDANGATVRCATVGCPAKYWAQHGQSYAEVVVLAVRYGWTARPSGGIYCPGCER